MVTDLDVPQLLADSCGGQLRPAEQGDAVAGIQPSYVVSPGSVDEVAAVVGIANRHRITMVPRGLGSRMSWGATPRSCDLVVDLSGLDAVRDHTASDMVVDVEAGVPLTRLAQRLAEAGQHLAIDPVSYDDDTSNTGSVGGAIATAHSGPRRFCYGTVRDLLLGVTVVRADGTLSTSGSRVVKNVAGYDLGKLVTGSFGGLGFVVSATFRLHPVPPGLCWVVAEADGMDQAHRKAWSIVDSHWEPTAVAINQPGDTAKPQLAVCLEGTVAGAKDRAERVAAYVHGEVTATAPPWFGRVPGGPANTVLTIATLPDAVPHTCRMIAELAPASPLRIDAGSGIITVSLDDRVDTSETLQRLRDTIDSPGTLTVRHPSSRLRPHAKVWGQLSPEILALTQRVKAQFDPSGVLAPGRIPGGV